MPIAKFKPVAALLLASTAVFLAACQSDRSMRTPKAHEVLAGSTLNSTAPLIVAPGTAEVLLQDAAAVAPSALSLDYPYCRFRPGGPAAAARTIAPPSVYLITSLEYDERGSQRGGETRPVIWFNLQGGPQNAGGRLGCAVPFSTSPRLFLTPAEVQGAVAGYFNLVAAP
jgi:hypothetical protein